MKQNKIFKALRWAFPMTLPVLAGFTVLGIAYGVLMTASGFSVLLAVFASLVIYAGAMQFVTVELLLGAFNPVQAFFMALMINARHLFYGVSMLEKYKGSGWKKPLLIYTLCDETFSINCSAAVPDGIDRSWVMTWVSFLNYFYWAVGTALGAVFGSFVKFNTEGLDFCMTAMFVVILLEQFMGEKDHSSTVMGLTSSVVCLLIFGADYFIIPSMALILLGLSLLRLVRKDGGVRE